MGNENEPPLFEGEPERCSLCGESGHTHDDHSSPSLKAIVAKLEEELADAKRQYESLALAFENSERELGELAFAKKELAEFRDFRKRVSDIDRVMFVRQAVVALWAKEQHWQPDTYWNVAQALWAAKPEDC